MANMKPTVCGDNNLYVPDSGCSDCEELELRVRRLEECCADVKSTLEQLQNAISGKQDKLIAGDNITITGNVISATSDLTCETLGDCEIIQNMQEEINSKLEAENIIAGDNITVEIDGNDVVISSDCPVCDCTKEELLNCLGVHEIRLSMTDTDNISDTWDVLGRLSSESIGDGNCKTTKAELLSCLGAREMPMAITDTDGTTRNWIVLGRLRSESSGDGSRVSGYNCTKWELLDALGCQEFYFTMSDGDASKTWTLLGRPL